MTGSGWRGRYDTERGGPRLASLGVLARLFGEDGLGKWALYAPTVFVILFFIVPTALTVVWSFFERTMFWMEPGFTLFSYVNFFTSARFENFLFSMLHSSVSVVVSFIIGFPIAVFVRRHVPTVAQHRVILLFILPFMVSEIIRTFMLRPVLGRNGLGRLKIVGGALEVSQRLVRKGPAAPGARPPRERGGGGGGGWRGGGGGGGGGEGGEGGGF